jgi:hypothetical protein
LEGDAAEDGEDLLEGGHAERREVGAFREGLVAELAFRLEAAEFGGGSGELILGMRAGSGDSSFGGFITFELQAAMETPGGADDLAEPDGLDGAGGGEIIEEFGFELFELFTIGIGNIVAGGEEAILSSIVRGGGFAIVRAGSG